MQKWTKLHLKVWFDVRLRVHPKDVRCFLADTQSLADEEGLVDVEATELAGVAQVTERRFLEITEILERLGMIRIERQGIDHRWRRCWVVSVERDFHWSDSRVEGGRAARKKQNQSESAPTPTATQGETPSEPLASGVSPSGAQKSEAIKPRRGKRINAATYPLPPSLDHPDVRAALVDYCRTRKGGAWDEDLALVRVRNLEAWGRARAVAALIHCVGYAGLFEPNGRPTPTNTSTNGPKPSMDAAQSAQYLGELRALPTTPPPANLLEMLQRAKNGLTDPAP